MASCRFGSLLFAGLLLLALTGCSTSEEMFPSTDSLRLQVRDESLAFQSTPGRVQVMRWVLESATATVTGVAAPFSFLGIHPCTVTDNVFFRSDIGSQCGGTGIILGTDAPTSAVFHLTISRIELRRAAQPDLSDTGDYDGDGVLNASDNCKLVANPPDPTTGLQIDSNGDGVGDACTYVDSFGIPVPDQDGDTISDPLDNCLYVSNVDQADSNLDFIGDACAQFIPAVLSAPVSLDCPVQSTPTGVGLSVYIVKFDDQTAFTCTPSYSSCVFDPTKVTIYRSGTDPTTAQACVPVP